MNLLQNKFDPITKEISFLECDIDLIATAYHSWMTEVLSPFEMRVEAQSGDPFPFEETQNYNAKKISERFTGEMLDDYLQHLGIKAFEDNFYTLENRSSVLFNRRGQLPSNLKEISL
jgi:hypothetical protein